MASLSAPCSLLKMDPMPMMPAPDAAVFLTGVTVTEWPPVDPIAGWWPGLVDCSGVLVTRREPFTAICQNGWLICGGIVRM